MDLQPVLIDSLVKIEPLKQSDFDILYEVAADPLIWEQHPNRDRYKKQVFEIFFKGAVESKGAFLIRDAVTGKVIGSSRYYDFNADKKTVCIGYTFFARSHWGGKYNPALKKLMIEHAFKSADTIFFHIGACNVRSQKAIERMGAIKTGEKEMAYYGEPNKPNFIYQIEKNAWFKL